MSKLRWSLGVVAPWEVFARAGTIDSHLDVAVVRVGGPPLVTAANGLQRLSMGTSQDWRVAVQEGATIIRLGTALFV